MAPTITTQIIYSTEHLTLNNKLRKPMVEKLRRDRINSNIEKLKSLLGREFLKQQPDSRQEKADILEMTVHFLKQQQKQNPSTCSSAASDGYSRCVQEAVNFLSQCHVQSESQRRLLSHFHNMRSPTEKIDVSFHICTLQLIRPLRKRKLQSVKYCGGLSKITWTVY